MQKSEYRAFLDNNFKGLKVRTPLFYSWDIGIRFNLQIDATNDENYFHEVNFRASSIFNDAFDTADSIFIIFMDYKNKRSKIRLSNYIFKQIKNLEKINLSFTKEKQYYSGTSNICIIKTKKEDVIFQNIFKAIANSDFEDRKPRLDKSCFSSKEVYFINLSKKIIFNMYDDRGLDIIASDKEILKSLYEKYNDWVLDYDREKIDKVFL